MLNIVLFFMQGIPEMTGVVALSLSLARVSLRWGRVIAVGTVLSIIIYIIRSLPFTFGLHSIVGICLLAIYIAMTTHVLTSRILIAVFVSFATLAIIELVIYETCLAAMGLDAQIIKSNYLLWQLLALPQALLMNILAVLVSKYKKPKQEAWRM